MAGISAIVTLAAGVTDKAGAVEPSTKILWRCLFMFHKQSNEDTFSKNHYVLLKKKICLYKSLHLSTNKFHHLKSNEFLT